jgi:DNA adenine methylase
MVIIEHLQEYAQYNSEEHYYRVRAWYNEGQTENGAKRAATFIYLNKTCFNGIWRVNKKGEFNVPYGHKDPPALPSKEELLAASIALRSADIRTGDFREVLNDAEAGDFVYLDPPYPPVSETAYFTHYTRHRFSRDDQGFVAEMARSLDARGCKVLISNADIGFIRALYEDFNLVPLRVTRWVNASGKRRKVGELAIMNYEIP